MASTQSTKNVLDHHLNCFGEGNLHGILSDYTSNSILFTKDGPLTATEALKPFFERVLAEFESPERRSRNEAGVGGRRLGLHSVDSGSG